MSSTGRCFDIGNTVSSALHRFERTGEPFSGSTDSQSAGNGCIMRLAPVPMFFFPDREAAVRMSGESSRTTHGAAECVEASQLFGAILFDALAGKEKEQILFHHGVANLATSNVRSIASGDYRSKTELEIKSSGYVVHCLEAALWCFWHSNDFSQAVLLAVNLGDDADTTGTVCGQLAGAFYGESGIPTSWRQRLARSHEIANLAIRLLQSRAEVCNRERIDSQKSSA
jgi:ADP-ribosyl-[dinitrogen reductase] hydrolase